MVIMFDELYLRVIVCGGRNLRDYSLVKNKMIFIYGQTPLIIVSGMQISKPILNGRPNPDEETWFGADWFGIKYGREMGFPIDEHPAKWNEFGRAAGPIRNTEMSEVAKECVAFWDRISRGTKDMITKAEAKNLKTHIEYFQP